VAFAEEQEAVPILIVPPGNDARFEPNRSFLPPATPRGRRDALARKFRAVRRLEATDRAAALREYRDLATSQPGFAETHFRLARLLEDSGDWEEAYRQSVHARDLDGLPMRCPSDFQSAYGEVAAQHRVILVDGQAYFHAIGPHGRLDDTLFMDAMHPSLRGQIALAQAILEGLRARREFGLGPGSGSGVIDPAGCAQHFGLDARAWVKLCQWGAMVYDLLSSGPHDPADRLARRDAYRAAGTRIIQGTAPEAVGLSNVGTPSAVPLVPEAFVLTEPHASRVEANAAGSALEFRDTARP
jgi:hypothetical protein